MKPAITRYFPLVLILFHIIGFVLFMQSKTASDLTWVNLALCGTLVFLAEDNLKKATAVFLAIFMGGYFIELIGTQTGYLFGSYAYGEVLGWRLMGVSVIIGVNWYAIVLAASNLARFFKLGVVVQSIIAGALCVGMDFVIEPVAIKFGFWSWSQNEIPLFNYLTWFAFATFFSYIYLKNSRTLNKTAAWLFFIWLAFFILLGMG